MVKANKSTFAALKRTDTITIEFGEDIVEFDINTVKVSDIVYIENQDNIEDRFELIRRSLIDSIPDITMEDVLSMPISVAEQLIKGICELNDIELPEPE
jgi:hypothetical protein